MAKELPYFKFNVSEYLNGSITLEDYRVQGLFVNICAHYWFKSGEITLSEMKRRLTKSKEKDFKSLIDNGIVKLNGDFLKIDFLDEQLNERETTSKVNSRNGSLGGRPKSENKPTALFSESETKANESNIEKNKRREEKEEEKRREEKKREEKSNAVETADLYPTFNDFWNLYDKKQDRPKCELKWKKINHGSREKIMKHLELYVRSTPDKAYRKNPLTYLNNQSWDNEVIFKENDRRDNKKAIGGTGTINLNGVDYTKRF